MKKTILISIAFLFALSIFAQSPHMFNYQAVVRSPIGDILDNQNVSFEIVILQTSPTGTPVYTETHNATTNEYGLVTLKIGDGVTSDDLSAIDWGADDYFMKVSMDEEGGTNYQEMGITQLLSVPYSLYSESAENISDNSVTSAKILDGEVSDDDIAFNYAGSSSKGGPATSIADNTVTSAKIQNGEVQADDIADGATLAEILDDDGSGSGLDADLLDGLTSSFYYTPKVAFQVFNSFDDNITSPSSWQKVEFNSEKFDIGSNFDNTTDVFTAPYDGVYTFSAVVGLQNVAAGSQVYGGFYINDAQHSHFAAEAASEDYTSYSYMVGGSATVQLNAGNTVDVRIWCQDANYDIYGSSIGQTTHFSGHLVF